MSISADLRTAMARGWPPVATSQAGGFLIQHARGAGSRVSAAVRQADMADAYIPAAEAAMRALGQPAIFAVEAGDAALDAALAERGYHFEDDTFFMIAPAAEIAQVPPKPVSAFAIWPPLAIQRDLWAAGDIGPSRLAIMDRAEVAKAALLGRVQDRAAGVGYVAEADGVAFVHAVYVLPEFRRLGLARNMMRAAAVWAGAAGADRLALVARRENTSAITLYTDLGMVPQGGYHYRRAPA